MDDKNLLNCNEKPVWFALSAPFNKEFEAQKLLEKHSIENFLPLQYKLVQLCTGKKVKKLVPAVSNLIFARTTKAVLQDIKCGVKYLQYKTRKQSGKNIPIIVPDEQMKLFMAVCGTLNEKLIYLSPDEINIAKGTKVKIIGGTFDGVEGIFMKVSGTRNKRVVVMIEGLTAVATAEISGDLLQVMRL